MVLFGADLGAWGVHICKDGRKVWSGSGSLIVTMMQPAESIMREDATRTYGTRSVVRRSLPQSEMRAVFVIVADVFREQTR